MTEVYHWNKSAVVPTFFPLFFLFFFPDGTRGKKGEGYLLIRNAFFFFNALVFELTQVRERIVLSFSAARFA